MRRASGPPLCIPSILLAFSQREVENEPMKHEQSTERITGLKIPDEDAQNWIDVFRNAGFSNEQVDEIMTRLNDTYMQRRFSDFIERELATVVTILESRAGKGLDENKKELLRQEIVKGLQGMDFSELQRLTGSQNERP